MLADSIVSLGYLTFRSIKQYSPQVKSSALFRFLSGKVQTMMGGRRSHEYTALNVADDSSLSEDRDCLVGEVEEEKEAEDAPLDQQISNQVVSVGLVVSILFCIGCIHYVFGELVPLYATVTAVFMALVLSIMGVRALGETDLNPVSGISKLAQLFFALIIPQGHKSSVLINLVAGAVSEAVRAPSCPPIMRALTN